jgi:hypothetical protein
MSIYKNKKSKNKRKVKESCTLESVITHPEEYNRMRYVWVWSWSLNTEEALAHYGLLRREKVFVRKETGMEGEKLKFIDKQCESYVQTD